MVNYLRQSQNILYYRLHRLNFRISWAKFEIWYKELDLDFNYNFKVKLSIKKDCADSGEGGE